jgi:hemerythrin-like domain-containing protein
MKATTNLENDHLNILCLIDVMERITHEEIPDIGHLENILELIRNFADGLHHHKEEKLLFPKMVEKGFSFEQGPIAVMMQDHVQGRNYVKNIANNIALYKNGDGSAIAEIYKNMLGYAELLRGHIGKENNVLFRMADNVLSEEEQQQLLAEFEILEQNRKCGDESEDCIKQIENLLEAYNL